MWSEQMNVLLQRSTANGWWRLPGDGREVEAGASSPWGVVFPGKMAQNRVKEPELDAVFSD